MASLKFYLVLSLFCLLEKEAFHGKLNVEALNFSDQTQVETRLHTGQQSFPLDELVVVPQLKTETKRHELHAENDEAEKLILRNQIKVAPPLKTERKLYSRHAKHKKAATLCLGNQRTKVPRSKIKATYVIPDPESDKEVSFYPRKQKVRVPRLKTSTQLPMTNNTEREEEIKFHLRNLKAVNSEQVNASSDPKQAIDKITSRVPFWQGLLIVLAVFLFSIAVSLLFAYTRNSIFLDRHILDTFFDSGGNVNAALMSCYVVIRWLWIESITTVTISFQMAHVAGQILFSISGCVPIIMSTVLAFRIRTIAPGAKTFLQVVRARLDSSCHILFVILALMNNLLFASMILSGATRITTSICDGISGLVMCPCLAIAALISSCVSGLGGSIYFSYFACAFTSSTMLVYLNNLSTHSSSTYYSYFLNSSSASSPEVLQSNSHESSAPEFSHLALYAAIRFISSLCTTVMDQSFWMSATSSKPGPAAKSHIAGGICWFLVIIAFSFVFGIALSSQGSELPSLPQQTVSLLSDSHYADDLFPVYASQLLMGKSGHYMMFCLTIFLFLACIVPQLLSSSSIVLYDIILTYFKPLFKDDFYSQLAFNDHLLKSAPEKVEASKKEKKKNEEKKLSSTDDSSLNADDSTSDEQTLNSAIKKTPASGLEMKMKLLDMFLERQKFYFQMKNISIVLASFLVFGVGALFYFYEVGSMTLIVFMGVLFGSSLFPIIFVFFWEKVIPLAVLSGVLLGIFGAVVTWLVLAVSHGDEVKMLYFNCGIPFVALVAVSSSVVFGGVICATMSLVHKRRKMKVRKPSFKKNVSSDSWVYRVQMEESGTSDANIDLVLDSNSEDVWLDTLAIDSPVISWVHLYAQELEGNVEAQKNIPSKKLYSSLMRTLNYRLKKIRVASYFIPSLLSILLLLLFPVTIVLASQIPTAQLLNSWKMIVTVGALLASVYLIVAPLLAEVMSLLESVHKFSSWKCRYARAIQQVKTGQFQQKEHEKDDLRGEESHCDEHESFDLLDHKYTGDNRNFRFAKMLNYSEYHSVKVNDQTDDKPQDSEMTKF